MFLGSNNLKAPQGPPPPEVESAARTADVFLDGNTVLTNEGEAGANIRDYIEHYPKFADEAAETIWLHGQLIRALRDVGFLLELKKLNADVQESAFSLTALYREECGRHKERIIVLERELARVMSRLPEKLIPNETKQAVGVIAAFPKGRWASKADGGLG